MRCYKLKKLKILKKLKEIYVNSGLNKRRLENAKKIDRERYKKLGGKENITILSPNCIAGEIYSLLGLKFNSPTINGSMKRKDFFKFCSNLDEYLKIEPYISGHSNGHPILSLKSNELDKIDIRFVHDNNDDIVLENWNRRKKRIIKDEIYIICDNKGIYGEELDDGEVKKINNVKSKKTIIFVSRNKDFPNTYLLSKKQIKRYNYKKLNGLYGFQEFFDYVEFLTKR